MFFPLIALLVLAGRVLAFNITLGTKVLQSSEILNIPQTSVPPECFGNVTTIQQSINACKDDATCLCKTDLVANLQAGQQCMFNQLIAKNEKPADMRVGSTPFMAAYAKGCTDVGQNVTAAQITLKLPENWDGPFDAILPIGGVAVAVTAGGFLGVSALLLLSNLS